MGEIKSDQITSSMIQKAASMLENDRQIDTPNKHIQLKFEGKLPFALTANPEIGIKSVRNPNLPVYHRQYLIDLLEHKGEYYAILKDDANRDEYLKWVQAWAKMQSFTFHVVQNEVSHKATVSPNE